MLPVDHERGGVLAAMLAARVAPCLERRHQARLKIVALHGARTVLAIAEAVRSLIRPLPIATMPGSQK